MAVTNLTRYISPGLRMLFADANRVARLDRERADMLVAGSWFFEPYEPEAKPHWHDLTCWADDGGPQP